MKTLRASLDGKENMSLYSKIVNFAVEYRTTSLLVIIILFTVLLSSLYTDSFPTFYNFSAVMLSMSIEMIITIAMAILLISGEIDLSVGWNMSLAGIICTHLIVYEKTGIFIAVAITMLLAVIIGLFNGYVTAKIGVNSFITTLASGMILYGLALKISGGSTITHLPEAFNKFGQKDILKLQAPVWYALIIAVVIAYLMSKSTFFRQYYFIGSNSKAAVLSGMNVKKLKIMAFVITSILASFAGIVSAARYGNAAALIGQGMELKTITAAVVGGVSFKGGVGSIAGAILGVVFMALINNSLIIGEVNQYWQQVLVGLILLFAVIIDILITKRKA